MRCRHFLYVWENFLPARFDEPCEPMYKLSTFFIPKHVQHRQKWFKNVYLFRNFRHILQFLWIFSWPYDVHDAATQRYWSDAKCTSNGLCCHFHWMSICNACFVVATPFDDWRSLIETQTKTKMLISKFDFFFQFLFSLIFVHVHAEFITKSYSNHF